MTSGRENRNGVFRRWYKVFAAVVTTVAGAGALLFVVSPNLLDSGAGDARPPLPQPEASPAPHDETTQVSAHPNVPVRQTVRTARPLAPSEQGPMSNNFYEQIGHYKLSSVRRNPNDIRATKALVAKYSTSRGSTLLYYLYSFPSSTEAEELKQTWVGQLQSDQSFTPRERYILEDDEGDHVGTALYLTNPYEAILWTHGTFLAAISAEPHEGKNFYAHLYSPAK